MTDRLALALLLCGALAACDRPQQPREPIARPTATPTPTPTAAFGNDSAPQSIMQKEVIAETLPTAEATPEAPPRLPTATIAFDVGDRLDDAARAALDRLLADEALPADARFVVRGHTDSIGSDRDNLITSRRRARAVRDYLVDKGIAAERIAVVALGERRPVAPNAKRDGSDDPEGRARNRRVDVETLVPAPPEAMEPAAAEERARGAAAPTPRPSAAPR